MHRNPDAYHTLYCLAGLSAAQHRMFPSAARGAELRAAWAGPAGAWSVWRCKSACACSLRLRADAPEDRLRKTAFAETLSWVEEEGTTMVVGVASNQVVRPLSAPFAALLLF